jgi:hypothetical protein
MPIRKEVFFVTDDGENFLFEEDAIRHDLRMRGSAKLAAFLSEVPELSDVVECHGSDIVDEIIRFLSDWLFTSPASAILMDIVRQQEEKVAKAGVNQARQKVKP